MEDNSSCDLESDIIADTEKSDKDGADKDYLLVDFIKDIVNITENSKEHTIISKKQLLNMLENEFNIDMKNKIEFEVNAYRKVLETFLKKWPHWELFDGIIEEAKTKQLDVNCILQRECVKLKDYLNEALKVAKEHIASYTVTLQQKMKSIAEEQNKSMVALEIECSKPQLDALVFKKPNRKQGYTIFNIIPNTISSKISQEPINLKHILNWTQMQVQLLVPTIKCLRKNTNSIERSIVNLKGTDRRERTHKLSIENIYCRKVTTGLYEPPREYMLSFLKQLLKFVRKKRIMNKADFVIFNMVMQEFLLDIRRGPKSVSIADIKFHSHKYKYVRYSSVAVPEDSSDNATDKKFQGIDPDKYDLCLEEILTPCQQFKITVSDLKYHYDKSRTLKITCDFNEKEVRTHFSKQWLQFECTICHKVFSSVSDVKLLLQHFYYEHSNEGDWQCSGCKNMFKHSDLVINRWYHDCV